ncbi:ABC transporter substrate-binding protein [Hoeflea sp. G2-23]|uniref:ABC transporter substrate-binding protein n=1 Tax=Hoeflea algicola TaxID=2983763 RepID=A0ABT3ZBT3_9HYPH|nr:ABC transporter substrate-binding protein [Hoeflea algicola]MCY0149262.1 ABC transporter substrate-binding protein [Hoeflea algicola]
MTIKKVMVLAGLVSALTLSTSAYAQEVIKVGMSAPHSGAAAMWGQATDWLCDTAAKEIAADGGVTVDGKVYNFECYSYDNKYSAAEGAKVAQAMLNRDGIRFISQAIGTAPVRALQSLSERSGALMFTVAWGTSIKGPKFPLTFTQMNTPFELFKPFLTYVKNAHPDLKTVAMLSPNDASGQEAAPVSYEVWGDLGVDVVASDTYERGTTEFQPIAAKIAALNPDAVDLSTLPPGDAGLAYKELAILGWKGIQVSGTGTGTQGLVTLGGAAADGTYIGAAIPSDGKLGTEKQKALSEGLKEATGEHVNSVVLGAYDSLFALKAAMEKSQSLDPKVVAATLPEITFEGFHGTTAFGGAEVYGSPQQMLLPIIVSQIQDGKLVELERIIPDELKARLAK